MHFHWPRIIYTLLLALGLLMAANRHDKPKVGKENFWTSLISSSIAVLLLYFGGFFSQH